MRAHPADCSAGVGSPTVPIGFFNVTWLDGQAGAPLGAPRGQNLPPAAGGHACAEPVHAGAAANLRLIRSFRHEFSFKNRLATRADYTSRLSGRSSRPHPIPALGGSDHSIVFSVLFLPFPVDFFRQTDMAPGIDTINIDHKKHKVHKRISRSFYAFRLISPPNRIGPRLSRNRE
jgi:hypothetical protein